MKNAPFLHRIEYAAYLLVRGASRLFPHPWARRFGRSLGSLACVIDGRHRRVAEKNLAIAFPELPRSEHRRLARESFRHFGGAVCDAISATRFDLVELCRRFRFEGWEHVEAAEAAGRGYFVLGSHLGYWEFSARPIGLFRGTIHAVARPTDNPHLDRELRSLRESSGYEVIPKQGAARRMMQVLKSGGRVGILIDQRVQPREAISVPFFGRAALTTPALARLSLRTGAPVLPVFAYAEAGGRYRFVAHPPLFPTEVTSATSEEVAVSELTARYLATTEKEIREHPPEWLWMHDRWREPPPQKAAETSE